MGIKLKSNRYLVCPTFYYFPWYAVYNRMLITTKRDLRLDLDLPKNDMGAFHNVSNVAGFKTWCKMNFTSYREALPLHSFPLKGGSPDLIWATEGWGDNTEGQSLFFPTTTASLAFTMTPVESTCWHANTIGRVLSIKPWESAQLFMLLLFIWLQTKQSLHFQLQHCQR